MEAIMQNIKDMNRVKLGLLVGGAVLLVALFIFASLHMATPGMVPLYSNLTLEDSAAVVTELEKNGIPYELRANGTQIAVPSDKVMRTRLSLAQQGLPSGGSIVGYEIFDRSEALGTSNFVLNVNMLRALEGELARTIGSMAQVESARVHLVIPKRELFSRDKQDPSASIYLKLRGSGELSKQEIAAISHLAATAVPGLKPAGITIVDHMGRMLAKGGEDANSPELAASNAQEYRVGYENRMKSTIESLLERSLGAGKVKITVNADIDFDRIVRNSEKFDPEGQVARSVQGSQQRENSSESSPKDNVSVANNLPDANAGNKGETRSNRTVEKSDEVTNYEISKVVENHVKETGSVRRLSVAVLVDGTYQPNSDGEEVYNPRSAEELKQIETLVKTASGFDEKRGDTVEVVNMRFTPTAQEQMASSALDWVKEDLGSIIQTLVLGAVAILAILLVVRPLVNRLMDAAAPQTAAAGAAGGVLGGPVISADGTVMSAGAGGATEEDDDTMIDIDRIQGKVRSSSFRKINEIIDKHPDDALNVIRQWVYREV